MYNKVKTTISQNSSTKHSAFNICQLFPQRTEDECLAELKQSPKLYWTYKNWPDDWKKRFMEFMEGKKSLPLTYDPFFKKIFNPDIYPKRLSRLISSIIGTNVTVKYIMSNEDSMLPSTSLLLLDIIVQLEDGSIANVEIQKNPYTFPGERMSCYSADLLLRQYTRVKNNLGKDFTYKDMRTVYTIVMYEKSPNECLKDRFANIYLHHGRTIFNTGVNLSLLQEYYVVNLDVFKNSKYAKDINDLNAWLSLLTADSTDNLATLISNYPWMESICQDISEYLYRPEEVISMFSKALKKMDENTVNFMIEQMKKALEEKDAALSEKDAALSEKDTALSEKDAEIAALQAKLAALEHQCAVH